MDRVTAFANLRDALASIFISEAETRIIVFDADLNVSSIEFSGQAVLTWHHVLRQAEFQNRIARLLAVVIKKYPVYLPLHDAIRDYCVVTGETSPDGLLPVKGSPAGGMSPGTTVPAPGTPELTPVSQPVSNVRAWLKRVGFEPDPFADLDAGREAMLPAFFVETPLYLDLVDPHLNSTDMIISGESGSGKSALRRMVALAPQSDMTSAVAIEFTCCCWLSQAAERNWRVSALPEFVRMILQGTVEDIVHLLLSQESSASQPILQSLKWFWITYGTTASDPDHYFDSIVDDTLMDRIRFSQAWRAGDLSSLLATAEGWDRPGIRNLATLVDAYPIKPDFDPRLVGAPYRQLIGTAVTLGLTSIQLLIDCQVTPTSSPSKLNSVAPLVGTILAEPSLKGIPNAAFRFFMTPDDVQALSQHIDMDVTDFRVRDLQWNDDGLHKLLSQRLIAFSDGKIADVAQLCDDKLAKDIESLLFGSAQGVPRNLLQMVEKLILAHCLRNGEQQLLLSHDDWEAAQRAFGFSNVSSANQV